MTTSYNVYCDCGCGTHHVGIGRPYPAQWIRVDWLDERGKSSGKPLLFNYWDCVTRYAAAKELPGKIAWEDIIGDSE